MNIKKIVGAMIIMAVFLPFTGCGKKEQTKDSPEIVSEKVGYQLEKPLKSEEIAVIHTSEGTFKMRFFPECAPKAVENFKSLAKSGYYNNVTFHRVIKDFMVQTGDPQGNGTGGESVWKKDFEDEFSADLLNISGAVSMANRGPNTNGSQFFINNQNPKNFRGWQTFEQTYKIYEKNPEMFSQRYGGTLDMSKITDKIKNLYETNGGNPNLDGFYNTAKRGHTVFAQVFEGMETVNKISECETGENDKPTKPIFIKNIEIKNFEEK